MAFKPPGGELNFWSGLWTLAGGVGAYLAIGEGISLTSFLMMFFGTISLGIWFQQKWCGWTIVAISVLLLPLALYSLFTGEYTWREFGLKCLRIAISAYTTYLCYMWARKEDDGAL